MVPKSFRSRTPLPRSAFLCQYTDYKYIRDTHILVLSSRSPQSIIYSGKLCMPTALQDQLHPWRHRSTPTVPSQHSNWLSSSAVFGRDVVLVKLGIELLG